MVIIDCAIMNKRPGEICFIREKDIKNYSFSSHAIPITVIIKYLKNFINSKFVIIGIQPKIIDFCDMSEEVKNAGDRLINEIIKLVKE